MFGLLSSFFQKLGRNFSLTVFIYGPRYNVKDRAVLALLNYMSGQAKLATWLSRKRMIKDGALDDVAAGMKRLIKARLKIEFAYYKLTNKTERFVEEWCIENALASVESGSLIFNF